MGTSYLYAVVAPPTHTVWSVVLSLCAVSCSNVLTQVVGTLEQSGQAISTWTTIGNDVL